MDLVSYVHNFLKGPGKDVMARNGGSLAFPGRSMVPYSPNIIDGEWSEVPRLLGGPKGALVRGAAGAAGRAGLTGPMGAVIAAGDGRPDNSLSDMQGLTDAYKQARLAKQAGMPPVQPLDDAPQRGAAELPWWASGDMTKMYPGANPAQSAVPMPQPRPDMAPQAPQQAGVPMPMARPADAPQPQPDTSFFMRNALMMQDPVGGGYIDPQGAASVRGPDLISKMMALLHNKAST